MKNKDFYPEQFQELTRAENFNCNGGGFAFDVGRLLRFCIISGNGSNVHIAIADFVANTY